MKRSFLFIYSITIPFVSGFIGSLFTFSQIGTWYQTLEKPFFNPPNWVFAPVWSILYLLMGVALFNVLNSKKSKARTVGIKFFHAQLILNALWSIVFFGMENPSMAFVIIVVLWGLIFATYKNFKKVDEWAGKLLIPYLVWVVFASILNIAIVILNT